MGYTKEYDLIMHGAKVVHKMPQLNPYMTWTLFPVLTVIAALNNLATNLKLSPYDAKRVGLCVGL
jgi:hypothetical protein